MRLILILPSLGGWKAEPVVLRKMSTANCKARVCFATPYTCRADGVVFFVTPCR